VALRPSAASGPTPYRRRRPERTLLYRTVQPLLETGVSTIMIDIGQWLASLGLGRYQELFVEQAIDVGMLPELTDDDLKGLGIPLGDRKRLLRAIALLSGVGGANATPADAEAAPTVDPTTTTSVCMAERRHITVLFCDLVGSTQLSTQLDPEDLSAVLADYRRCCADAITRWGGYVAKYMGDGVLAYFGWPQAHEDDAEAAVHAALQLVRAVGRLAAPRAGAHLAARAGIATGEVVVGDTIGQGAAQEHNVVGETPNLAARMQALARADSVVIDARTRRLVGDLFELTESHVAVKGFAEPVPAYEVIAASATQSRFQALHPQRTVLIGRDEEISALLRRWDQAIHGEGQVVLLCGEPGIGKSRMLDAFAERLADAPHMRLRYFCSPHHTQSPLHPFVAQLENAAGFVADDPNATKYAKLVAVLRTDVAAPSEDAALLAELALIVPGEHYRLLALAPEQKKERTFEALLTQLEALAAAKPVLILFEDLHWIDPTSHALFDRMVEAVERLPVLVVATFRPEFAPRWVGASHVSMQTLRKFSRRESDAFVERLTGGKALPPDVAERIIAHTDGVPLFVEELTRAVLEGDLLTEESDRYVLAGPLPAFAIPTSLQASLIARLDRLAPLKDIAQIGATIGREFPYELLAAVAGRAASDLDAALEQLVQAGLLFRRGTRARSTLAFKHALVRDAAYASLLRSRRQELHARIAQTLEKSFPARAAAEPEIVAQHLTEAGLDAAATLWWSRAGRQSLRRAANPEAVAQLGRALDLLARLPASRERDEQELDLLINLGPALINTQGWNSPEVRSVYVRALAIASRLDKPDALLASLVGRWATFHLGGRYHEALEVADEVERLARASSHNGAMLQAHHLAFPPLLYLGDVAKCRSHIADMLALYDEPAHREHRFVYMSHDPAVCGHAFGAMAAWFAGDIVEAHEAAARADALARRLGHAPTLAHALYWTANVCVLPRDVDGALAMSNEVLDLTRSVKHAPAEASAQSFKGWALVQRGEIDEGLRLLEAGLVAWRAQQHEMLTPHRLCLYAEGLLAAGRASEASAAVAEALALVERNDERTFAPIVMLAQAEVLLAGGDTSGAERVLGSALEAAARARCRSPELRAATRLALLWAERGERDRASDLLAPVVGGITPMAQSRDIHDASALLEALRRA